LSMKLIVGLGNPGKEYSANRHNVGFHCLNYLAKANHISFDKKQGKARIGAGVIAANEVVLAKPQTYMNLSGQAVAPLMQRYYLALDDLMVIHDDMDLPLGKIRIRKASSAGGHNGAKSIIASLGSQDFVRIRVGIGRPELPGESKGRDVVDYVLGDFDRDEMKLLENTIPRVAEAVVCLLTEGLEAAMNKFNTQPPAKS
jgi:PTH1 family peptidyl-tRNA hydrolase